VDPEFIYKGGGAAEGIQKMLRPPIPKKAVLGLRALGCATVMHALTH